MAWIAVNKNGDETISPDKPTKWSCEWADMDDVCLESECGLVDMTLSLPKGSIYKLIGRELTWKNEPVELI